MMLKFTFKFMKSMFQENKKEVLFVLLGMVLCVFVVLNFTDSALGTDYSEEELAYENNRVTFTFSDIQNLEPVMNAIAEEDGVQNVLVDAACMIEMNEFIIQSGVKLPRIDEDAVFNGEIPKKLAAGEALISTRDAQGPGSFIAVGDTCALGDYDFTNVAQIGYSDISVIIGMEDFIKLCNEYGHELLEVTYIYEDGFTGEQKKKLETLVADMKKIDEIREAEKISGIDWAVYIGTIKDLILGMIIAVLNDMFLYAYILNSRIPAYSVLKLQGVSNRNLRRMLFAELIVLYIIAYVMAGGLYAFIGLVTGNLFYNTAQIYVYTFVSILALNIVLFSMFIRKLIKAQPFEIYQNR